MGRINPVWCVFLAMSGWACSDDYGVRSLAVVRTGWDTLAVDALFEERRFWGISRPVVPDTLEVTLFGAAYDTLYTGDGSQIVVDDQSRASDERLLMEACAVFGTCRVCAQEAVRASAKRLVVRFDITFADSTDVRRGMYALEFGVERLRADGAVWEQIAGPRRVLAELHVGMDDPSEPVVIVPLGGRRGTFDLERARNWEDLRFALATALMQEDSAAVRVELHAGPARGEMATAASFAHWVYSPLLEDRWREVEFLRVQAAQAIISELSPYGVTEAYVPDTTRWSFDRLAGAYRIDLKVEWRAGRGMWHSVQGLLRVDVDSTRTRFILRGARGGTRRLWDRRIGAPEFMIPGLRQG